MATVQFTEDAREDLRDLDGAARKKVLKAVKKLETSPEQRGLPLGATNIGDLTGFRKLVVGDREFRVIYTVAEDGSICVVWVIGKRADDEVYRLAVARLQTYQSQSDASVMQEMLDSAFQRSR